MDVKSIVGISTNFLTGGGGMTQRILEKNWESTSVGDIESWPQSMRSILSVCLNLKSPAILLWGQDLNIFVNDAFKNAYPANRLILGAKGREVWASAAPLLDTVMFEGKATYFKNELQLIERGGFTQETYFTYYHTPVYDESGGVGGIFTLVDETTEAIISARRQHVLNELAKKISFCAAADEIFDTTIQVLENHPRDFPMAVFYKIDNDGKTAHRVASTASTPSFISDHEVIDLYGPVTHAANLLKCVLTKRTVVIEDIIERVGNLPSGPWQTSPGQALGVPVLYAGSKYPVAVLSLLLNPHLKADEKYLVFCENIRERVEQGLANLLRIAREKEIAKAHSMAEAKLNNLFMQAPLAICILRGQHLHAELVNKKMEELVGISREELINKPFFDVVPSVKGLEQTFINVYATGKRFVADEAEIDFLRNGEKTRFFVKFAFEPLFDEEGRANGIMVIADDITEYTINRKKLAESEERLKIAIETAGMGTYSWETPQPGLVFSDRLAQIYGYEGSSNLTQADLQKSVHPDDIAISEKAYEVSKITGLLQYESRLIWPDGSLHWIAVRSRIFFNEKGIPIKLYGTAMDITVQKEYEAQLEKQVAQRTQALTEKNEELKRNEERYQRLTEEVEDYAIILLSPEGNILNWNRGAQKIKGYTEQDIVGKHFSVFYPATDQETRLPQKLLAIASQKGRAEHEGYRIRKDGTAFWGSIVITALHDKNNDIIGFTKVTRDLTERKKAEDKLKQYAADLEFRNKELEQFAYVTSHDLQEPLRTISMYMQLLEKKIPLTPESEIYIRKIILASGRMRDLIKSVLSYSQLSIAGPSLEITDLNRILEEVKSDFEVLIAEKQAVIFSDDLPKITSVSLQMHQLFSNLVSNSLKFSVSPPVIHIHSKTVDDNDRKANAFLKPDTAYVQLSFEDNGIGFAQEYADKIFEVFQRLHEKQAYSGTGIGLSLCKKIAENHHGFILAESQPGKGAKFIVYLPTSQ